MKKYYAVGKDENGETILKQVDGYDVDPESFVYKTTIGQWYVIDKDSGLATTPGMNKKKDAIKLHHDRFEQIQIVKNGINYPKMKETFHTLYNAVNK